MPLEDNQLAKPAPAPPPPRYLLNLKCEMPGGLIGVRFEADSLPANVAEAWKALIAEIGIAYVRGQGEVHTGAEPT